jgi:spore coat protein A
VRVANTSVQARRTALPGGDIPKYVEALPDFVGARVGASKIDVSLAEFRQQVPPAGMHAALTAPFRAGTFV